MPERFKHWNIRENHISRTRQPYVSYLENLSEGETVALILVPEAGIYSSSGEVSDCKLAFPFVPLVSGPSVAGRGKPSA